jgi:hypothetical protein
LDEADKLSSQLQEKSGQSGERYRKAKGAMHEVAQRHSGNAAQQRQHSKNRKGGWHANG